MASKHTAYPHLPDCWYIDGTTTTGGALMSLKADNSALGIVFNEALKIEEVDHNGFTDFEKLVKGKASMAEKIELVVGATVDSIHRS